MRWHDVASDPNAPAALAARARALDGVWFETTQRRTEFLVGLCRGQRVLDVGCVAHDPARAERGDWLHAHLRAVASRCVGVDADETGVARLRELGHDVVLGDVSEEPSAELAGLGPFDVIVAGEVIEHLDHPTGLLRFARPLLSADGLLVVTTPNPFAPWRVRAEQRGEIRDNVDHVALFFPSGMAELADRTGLVLDGITTVDLPNSRTLRTSMKALAAAAGRRVRGARSADPIGRAALPLRAHYLTPLDNLVLRYRRAGGRYGETAVYVFRLAKERS